MKILAIRGRNLASLAGDFELDFRREPLASAGLFAISGPTGSGKSTLLDTLCLALYNDTPRLLRAPAKGVNLPDVRGETITARDPRNVLRRGASEGLAEVEFVGNDGVGYLARWAVRRARGKAGGKLQTPEVALLRLSDRQPIGDGQREVLAEIERRLGLSFAQFTRAVLLAQNEFFAFLKADDNERAELLETLTGTDSFTSISRRAFERSKAEQESLRALTLQLEGLAPLGPEARGRLEAGRALAGARAEKAERRKGELEDELRWHRDVEAARAAEDAAASAWEEASAAVAGASARHARLSLVEAVQAARPKLADQDRAGREVALARKEAESARVLATGAAQDEEAAEGALASARAEACRAAEARDLAAPDLDRAKALDAQLEALTPGFEAAGKARDRARKEDDEAKEALGEAKGRYDNQGSQLEATLRWLAENEGLEALGEGWPRWDALLAQAEGFAVEQSEADRQVAVARAAEESLRTALGQAAGALSEAASAQSEARKTLEQTTRAVSCFDGDALAARKAEAELRRDRLVAAEQAWRDLLAGGERTRELETRRETLGRVATDAATALFAIAEARPRTRSALEQAERSLRIAQTACSENVETLRGALVAGDPCPVCGATDHPYASGDVTLQSALDGLEAEVKRLREEEGSLGSAEAAHRERARSAQEQVAATDLERGALERHLDALKETWQANPVAAEVGRVAAASRLDWFDARLGSIRAELNGIVRDEDAHRRALRARDGALEAADAASARHGEARETAERAGVALEGALGEARVAMERNGDAERRLNARLEELDGAFADSAWRVQWRVGPSRFRAATAKTVGEWLSQGRRAAELRAAVDTLGAELRGLADAAAGAEEQRRRAEAAFELAARELGERRQKRGLLLGGRGAAAAEAELAAAVEAAKGLEARRAEAALRALEHRSRTDQSVEQAAASVAEREHALAAARLDLSAWLADFQSRAPLAEPLDEDRLRSLLGYGEDWVSRERLELLALEAALQRAEAVRGDRAAQRLAKESERTGSSPAHTVAEALSAVAQELTAVREQVTGLEAELRNDDERRTRSAGLVGEVRAQEAVSLVWEKLSDLIGSADGKKFRNYAQQLTLDVLLEFANRHLSDLARRYRLERVKGTLSLLVVDRDMGDEVRSVHSLSGGETFLVSLALALGLASLSSNRVRVESLFVDEGFGSLDAETLGAAMDALDSLQAQGRKVGVISHVPEMTERIQTRVLVQKLSGGRSRVTVTGEG